MDKTDRIASKPRVLVVDDNESNLRLACHILSAFSDQVYLANSGENALQMFLQEHYDLVLMDIEMPHMDGKQTMQNMRSKQQHDSRTLIVALTAHDDTALKIDLLKSGMDDYLTKPLNDEALGRLLARWFNIESKNKEANEEPLETPKTEAVDAPASLALAKGKADLAADMLSMLLKDIANNMFSMREAWHEKKIDQLHEIVHRIHGGACYCGVPQLLATSTALDKALKTDSDGDTENLWEAFYASCEALIKWQKKHDIDSLFQPLTK